MNLKNALKIINIQVLFGPHWMMIISNYLGGTYKNLFI